MKTGLLLGLNVKINLGIEDYIYSLPKNCYLRTYLRTGIYYVSNLLEITSFVRDIYNEFNAFQD